MIARALALLLVAGALSAGTAASGADFVATTATPGNAFSTAADFNTVTAALSDPARASATVAARVVDNAGPDVTLADPGVLTGTATISASADDTGTGVADLTIEYRRPDAPAWTRLCGGSAASRSCTLDTTGRCVRRSRLRFRVRAPHRRARIGSAAVRVGHRVALRLDVRTRAGARYRAKGRYRACR